VFSRSMLCCTYVQGILIMLNGFLYGCTIPLYYELSIELTFPINSSVPTSILTISFNVVASIFLIGSDSIPKSYITAIVAATMLVLVFILIPLKEEYKRLDVDEM